MNTVRNASPPKPRAAGSMLMERSQSPTTMFQKERSGTNLLPAKTNNFDKVKKNAKGGVLLTTEEITSAFSLLDVENNGQITLPNLKKRIGVLFPEMSAMEYRFLMNNKKELGLQDLKDLLVDNEITSFDPVAEAYKIFESGDGSGKLDGEKLRKAFVSYGFGELSDQELEILTRTADVDGDGIVSLEDFRNMLDPSEAGPSNQQTSNARKLKF